MNNVNDGLPESYTSVLIYQESNESYDVACLINDGRGGLEWHVPSRNVSCGMRGVTLDRKAVGVTHWDYLPDMKNVKALAATEPK